MTALQEAIAAFQRESVAEMSKALTRCESEFQAIECRTAYADRNWKIIDMISQQHGMEPMLVRAPA